MEPQNHIVQELKELESSLPHLPHPYNVPAGYFAQLPEWILLRAKADSSPTAVEETSILSPVLAAVGKNNPYTVPVGYFESLDLSWVWASDESVNEELAQLSPLLAGLKKESPFSLPEGYFEKPALKLVEKEKTELAPVVQMGARKWFKYAAAVVVALVATTTMLLVNSNNNIDPNEKSYAWVEKNLKKVETSAIEKFVALTPGDGSADNVAVSKEVQSLLQELSNKDVEDFLMATGNADLDNIDEDDLFLN